MTAVMKWGIMGIERMGARKKAMSETTGLTAELKGVVQELTEAQARTEASVKELAEAQARTEASVKELAKAQARTEERVGGLERAMEKLAEAQARTEERVERLERAVEKLAEAQTRTEVQLRGLRQEVGALSANIGYGLEDIARTVLPGYLRWKFGLKVERLARQAFRVDKRQVDIDLYGEGSRDERKATLLGEVKARIYRREVVRFRRKVEVVRPLVDGEVFPLMFGYYIGLSAEKEARDEIYLVASYQPVTERQAAEVGGRQ